jgi:hypothetical protein
MSDTEEIKTTAPTTEGPLVPFDKIEPFYLTGTVHYGVLKGHPEAYLPKEALPYLFQERYFTIDPSDKQDWDDALAQKVGGGKQVCPFCDGSLRVDRKCLGQVTKISAPTSHGSTAVTSPTVSRRPSPP